MKIEQIELYHISMPLLHPFETSFGVETYRECILVAARADGLVGWGECVAGDRPGYAYETMGTSWHILRDFLIPETLYQEWTDIADFIALTAWVRGHQMAKASLQAAAWVTNARASAIVSRVTAWTESVARPRAISRAGPATWPAKRARV